ncbi:MAG: penicillin acylase family protein, partial [Ardenticatenaceae bacterium]
HEELPRLFNPADGFIVTANNAVVDGGYPYLLELQWDNGDRAERIEEMIRTEIGEDGAVSADDIGRMQMDSKSLLAQHYMPLLAALASEDARVQEALNRLHDWDLQLRRDSVPAALWEIFYMQLQAATLADELGHQAEAYLGNGGAQRVLFHTLAEQPDAPWWDDTTTEPVETRDAILLQALAETIAWFAENVGGEMDDWSWGRIHTATFVSNPLGQSGISVLEAIVNLGPYPVDGGSSAVNANGWSFADPASVQGHVSLRMIVDMEAFERSRTIHATGQSGHPFHPHYDDMFPFWRDGRYHPMLWAREQVEAAAQAHLVLRPR